MNKTLGSAVLSLLCAATGTGMLHATDYGLPAGIQEGNILHCFNWTASEIKAELPKIAEAGFGSVQMSPMQRPDIKAGSSWQTYIDRMTSLSRAAPTVRSRISETSAPKQPDTALKS